MKLTLSIPGADGTPIPITSGLPPGVPTGGLHTKGVEIIGVALEIVLIFAVFLSLFFMIRGGINMTTSGGDKERFKKGRERVRYAFIGLLLIFLSFFFVGVVGEFFGIKFLSP